MRRRAHKGEKRELSPTPTPGVPAPSEQQPSQDAEPHTEQPELEEGISASALVSVAPAEEIVPSQTMPPGYIEEVEQPAQDGITKMQQDINDKELEDLARLLHASKHDLAEIGKAYEGKSFAERRRIFYERTGSSADKIAADIADKIPQRELTSEKENLIEYFAIDYDLFLHDKTLHALNLYRPRLEIRIEQLKNADLLKYVNDEMAMIDEIDKKMNRQRRREDSHS